LIFRGLDKYSQGRLKSIDCLRGLAAFGVLLEHSLTRGNFTSIDHNLFLALSHLALLGALGVPLFFVLSGFCIHLSWLKKNSIKHETRFDYFSFWKRRLWRLYPTYFIVTCMSAGLMLIVSLFHLHYFTALYPEPKVRWVFYDFLAHVTMLHGFIPQFDKGLGNPVFWTLAREEYLYAIYPLLLIFRNRLRWRILIPALFILSIGTHEVGAIALSNRPHWFDLVSSSVLVVWNKWAVGAYGADCYQKVRPWHRLSSNVWMFLLWAVTFAITKHFHFVFGSIVSSSFLFFTLISFCVRLEEKGRWPEWRIIHIFSKLGIFSYSLYLTHYLVINICGKFLKTSETMWFLGSSILLIAISIVFARIFFHFFEAPFMRSFNLGTEYSSEEVVLFSSGRSP